MTANTTIASRAVQPRFLVEFVGDILSMRNVELDARPSVAPVTWEGFTLTLEECDEIGRRLEQRKLAAQETMNSAQVGGEVTQVGTSAAGGTAMVVGLCLLLFPPTALAGAITLASGAGGALIGNGVGQGVSRIGTNHAVQVIAQCDAYIRSLERAQLAALRDRSGAGGTPRGR